MFCPIRDQKGHANPHFRIEQHNLIIIVFESIQVKLVQFACAVFYFISVWKFHLLFTDGDSVAQ